MKPLMTKELGYIADMLSNEDLLAKRCVTLANQSQTPEVKSMCNQVASQHMQNYNQLQELLQQHANLAPTQAQ